jgi:hypothetical protein
MATVVVDPCRLHPHALGSTSHLTAVSLRSLLLGVAPWPVAAICGGSRSDWCAREREQVGRGWRRGRRGGGEEEARGAARGGNWLGLRGERGGGRILGGGKGGRRGRSQKCSGAFANNDTISSLSRKIV